MGIDATRVASKLYVGSFPPSSLAKRGIDAVVLCAEERQSVWPDIYTLRIPLDDGPLSFEDYKKAVKVAADVTRLRQAGKRVLVTCQMGVNRSALIAGLSMMQLERMPPARVLAQIRRLRGASTQPRIPLSNPDFERALYLFQQLSQGRKKT